MTGSEILRNRTIAVFGGTFNPIHKAHLVLANMVIKRHLADEVFFIPASRPPHKLAQDILPGKQRLEMIDLAINETPEFSSCDIELNHNAVSYTYNTLKTLEALYPSAKFRLIVGMDNLLDIHSWFKYQDILNNYEIISFTRPGYKTMSSVKLEAKFGREIGQKIWNLLINDVNIDISSSGIREKYANFQEIDKLIPEEVMKYIIENGIY